MAPVSKQWRVEKSQGHWHVRISKDEVLDVDTEKNARLISSAPEMHAALDKFFQYFELDNPSNGYIKELLFSDFVEAARHAMEKARI
jgi:hypothetical protein